MRQSVYLVYINTLLSSDVSFRRQTFSQTKKCFSSQGTLCQNLSPFRTRQASVLVSSDRGSSFPHSA